MIYKKRSNGWEHWTVYTSKDTVFFMLNQINYKDNYDLSSISVLDPCSWDGIFIICCMERLLKSSQTYNFSFEEAFKKNFLAIEIDDWKIQHLRSNIEKFLKENDIILLDFEENLKSGDFLLQWLNTKFDIVIWNPPYIRYDNIHDSMKELYKIHFKTFKGRCDVYIPFYEKWLELLKKNWKLCYICSNRWLKNDYWRTLRELISNTYDFDKIINLEHIKVFKEDVIAYPAITIIKNCPTNNHTEYYDIFDKEILDSWVLTKENNTKQSFLLLDDLIGEKWNFWQIKHTTFKSIEDQCFEIWIWPATWADKVFISKILNEEIENELLVPLILSRDLRWNNLAWGWNYLINPFTENWELIDLSKYPRLTNYLNTHRSTLLNRHIAKKNPSKWYRTIDKIKISLLRKQKLIVPDTSSNDLIMLDKWEFYPHHNLVYITHQDERNLKILWAILSSDFWKNQMRKTWNLMNWGFIRWQIQNLRNINLPDIDNIAPFDKEEIIKSYETGDIIKINKSIKITLENVGIS